MTSKGAQKLTSEMMKRDQQHRRTPRHESQYQLANLASALRFSELPKGSSLQVTIECALPSTVSG